MKTIFKLILSLTLFSSIAVAAEVPQVSQQQILSMQSAPKAAKFIVLDVRTAQEYAEQHIEGAINISHNEIEDKLSMLSQYKDSTVVVHCRSGKRAKIAQDILINNGFTKVKHLSGDMNGWLAADLPTVKQ